MASVGAERRQGEGVQDRAPAEEAGAGQAEARLARRCNHRVGSGQAVGWRSQLSLPTPLPAVACSDQQTARSYMLTHRQHGGDQIQQRSAQVVLTPVAGSRARRGPGPSQRGHLDRHATRAQAHPPAGVMPGTGQLAASTARKYSSRTDARPPQMTATNPMKCADDSY